MKTIIIIPCYNEAKRLPVNTFLDFLKTNSDVTFFFVNDGSTDNTMSVLEELTSKHSSLQYLDLEKNGGKAEAIRQGMQHVIREFNCEYVGFWDADLATPLDEIPYFINMANYRNYEMITGLRLTRLGTKVKRKTSRHYLGRIFATCASMVLRLPVYDTQCGAKLYRTDIVSGIFEQSFITRWLFDVEILARYVSLYGRENAMKNIYEYPVFQWEDELQISLQSYLTTLLHVYRDAL